MTSQYFRTFNKQIAVALPKEAATATKSIGGLSLIDEKLSLLELEVVFDSGTGFEEGDKIYVHAGSARGSGWYKSVYAVGDVQFVLVPEDFVLVASSPI